MHTSETKRPTSVRHTRTFVDGVPFYSTNASSHQHK